MIEANFEKEYFKILKKYFANVKQILYEC